MSKEIISTPNAPAAIGPYSQAVKTGNMVFLSGQIPLLPETMEMIEGGVTEQAQQVFKNLSAVAEAAGGSLNDAVKVNISLTDLGDFCRRERGDGLSLRRTLPRPRLRAGCRPAPRRHGGNRSHSGVISRRA